MHTRIGLDEFGVILAPVAADTVHGFAYLLADPCDDELGYREDLPSSRLL